MFLATSAQHAGRDVQKQRGSGVDLLPCDLQGTR